jgi:uncharacterized protein (TIGR01244 family)
MRRIAFSLVVALASVAVAATSCKKDESDVRSASATDPAAKGPAQPTETLEKYSCGTVERLHTWNGIFAGSQPAADDLRHAQANGIKTILNLRPKSEDPGFDEEALVATLGMEYDLLPFAAPAELSDEIFDRARAILRDESKRPVFFHCNSGNRVGAIWLAFRALDGGLSVEAALEEAKQVGLKTPALEQRAKEYVERARAAAGGQ